MQTLTDRTALAAHRARAGDIPAAGFLHDEARAEVHERLTEVNRSFTAPVVVSGHGALWGDWPVVPDDDPLALRPGAHDLVVHAMALHWADDPLGQIIQSRRALAPDGLFLGVMLGGQTLRELRAAFAEAETALTGGLSPRVAPMAEIRDLGGLLQRAGLALPVADSVPLTVRYRSARALMHDLRAMGENNALAGRSRSFTRRDLLARAEDIYARRFSDGDHVTATFELIFLAGWAPHPDQQKPLRPGSASARLAEALGTAELGAGDPPRPGTKDPAP